MMPRPEEVKRREQEADKCAYYISSTTQASKQLNMAASLLWRSRALLQRKTAKPSFPWSRLSGVLKDGGGTFKCQPVSTSKPASNSGGLAGGCSSKLPEVSS